MGLLKPIARRLDLQSVRGTVAFELTNFKNLRERFRFGELVATPLDQGVWTLLEPAGQQNHAPQLCWIGPDELACVWMAGDQEGTASMSVYGCVLRRDKKSWTKPRLLSQDAGRSEQNPLLFRSNDGRVHLIHTAQVTRNAQDASWQANGGAFSMQWTARLRHQSTASWGRPWTNAQDLIDEPAFCRHPPVAHPQGGWILPVYRSLEEGGAFGRDHSGVLPLDERGRVQGDLIEVPESVGRVHGSIVRSANGSRLLQFFRSRLADCIYRSVGSLDGMQWSSPEPTVLPNNNSSLMAIRLTSGLLALVFNRFGTGYQDQPQWGQALWPRTRWPLSIAFSEDDGATWPWVRDLDHGLGFCGDANWHLNGQLAYPSIVEGAPGEIHLAYSWANRAAIRYVCLKAFELMGREFD